ncbi:MAG: YfhO family protein, partial [Planctomycetaceae bacterium]|nr:YfhO family protein [Planctomycetaceae bacterium]
LAALAGFGWDALRGQATDRAPRRVLIVGALAVGWTMLLAFGYRAGAGTLLFAGAAIAACVALGRPQAWAWAAGAMTALDLGTAALLQLGTVDSGAAAPAPWYESVIRPEDRGYRVLDLDTYKAAPVAHGFRLLRGYGHPISPELADFYASAWASSIPALDSLPSGSGLRDVTVLRDLGVRWIVGGMPAHPDWKVAAQRDGRTLYEDPKAKPPMFLAQGAATVMFFRDGVHRMTAQVESAGGAELVVSESWSPGWHASADGVEVPIGRYRGALMKVPVPAGKHRLELVYRPDSWRRGRMISGAGAGALLILGAAVFVRRRRS